MEVCCSSRKRPCGRAVLQLHQEAQCQPPACKRRCKEAEADEMKRAPGGCEENGDAGGVLETSMRTLKKEPRRFSRSGTRTRVGSGFKSIGEVMSYRPEVRVALIRKTRIQTSVKTAEFKRSEQVQGLFFTGQTDPETQLDQRRPARGSTEFTSEVRSRYTAGPLRARVLVRETRTSRRRSEMVWGPKSCRREGTAPRISSISEGRTTKSRRRTKVHPSVFRGRGQLLLSITPETKQLTIHILKARGLMGKSQSSCDSYVQLAVTSGPNCSIMTTPIVLNSKNPEYNHSFTLDVIDDLVLDRLLVSVFSRSVMASVLKPRPLSLCPPLIKNRSRIRVRRPVLPSWISLLSSQLIGIGSLISSLKRVTGWFYLLGEEFGRSKHLRVTSQQYKPMRSLKDGAVAKTTTHCADLQRTPDSSPDTDLNHITTTTTAILSNSTSTITAELKDLTNQSLTSSFPQSLDPTNGNCSSHKSMLSSNTNQHQETRNSSTAQWLTVNVVRGKDGFGFTICSDCPVRVQAVDSGGPAHQSGLRQGDSVLQLNGLPVETWKCVDLAQAIRNCPSHIVLVVWRGLPELRSGCDALLRPVSLNTTTGRKLLPYPTHSKHGRRRGQGLRVTSTLGALGSLWRDRKEEEEQGVAEYSPRTTTLKGTQVTSSHGDNYIILSPVNTGVQLLQPVYHDRNGTIGRLYQTHPSSGQNLLHDSQPGLLQRPFNGRTSTLPPPTSSSSAPPSNYGNYQNCTIVQSHLPCSSYGTYATLEPKTLIFPIFVQPLDLCSPDRTLLMAEDMVLHQADLLPAKVTVLIYSDLLLFTREDEAGRCNVLQSPLYLNTLQLREVSSQPLLLYFLQGSPSCCRCLFSLEAFSIEQKVRVSLCLHDNIQLQLVTTEIGHTHQPSDLPSDFGLLSLRQSDLLYRSSSPQSSDPPLLRPSSPYSSICDPLRHPSPSPYSPNSPFSSSTPPPPLPSLSPYTTFSSPPCRTFTTTSQLPFTHSSSSTTTLRSPVWKERGGSNEEEEDRKKMRQEEAVEERQQGEGESASETSENVGGVGGQGLQFSTNYFNNKEGEETDEEEDGGSSQEFISMYRPEGLSGLRRSLSEGSLLQEPRSPRFLSDSTIHRLTRPAPLDLHTVPCPPSIHTLRKQLTREGGSLHHMLLLLNGTKGGDFRNLQLRKKTKSLAADVRSRLPFLRRRQSSTCFHGSSLEKALRNNRPSTREVLRWAESLEALLTNQYGLAVFRHFLRSEFSEENLDFWLAVERFKKTRPVSKMAVRAAKIYDEFICTSAGRQVNVDSSVRESTNQSLRLGISPASFQLAQDQIFCLMETDSYPRFLRSHLYSQLANQGAEMATKSSN